MYFVETSEDPLKDGYMTMIRIVSRIAYEQYYGMKPEFDKNPEKRRYKSPPL